jgi:U6 snRNA-associated Sm-like protein LSm3
MFPQCGSGARTAVNKQEQAYDSHCNLVLGDVEETIFVAEEEEDDQEPRVRTVKKQSEMLFVRGGSLMRVKAEGTGRS